MVPHQKQPVFERVVEREGEDADQLCKEVAPEGGVSQGEQFGVAGRGEAPPGRLDSRAQRVVIVDLAVIGNDETAILAHHRLVPALGIDNGEPGVPEMHAVCRIDTVAIGSAMPDRVHHAPEQAVDFWARISGYATHESALYRPAGSMGTAQAGLKRRAAH